jgi:hypothetical protein
MFEYLAENRPTVYPGQVVPVAAAALGAGELGESVNSGAGVGMRIEADAALGADTAPLAGEQRAAEQVGPDRHAVEPPFVAVGADTGQGHRLGEERELDRVSVHDQCRACGFDGQGAWHGALVCPRCGSRTAVRAAATTEERTDAELAAIAAAVPGGEDLAEDG